MAWPLELALRASAGAEGRDAGPHPPAQARRREPRRPPRPLRTMLLDPHWGRVVNLCRLAHNFRGWMRHTRFREKPWQIVKILNTFLISNQIP